jgi:serine/threonine protein kinase
VYKGSCNPEIDIYGLGATMYFMLTGKDLVSIEGLINSSLYNLMFYVITRENPLKLVLEEFRISNDLFSNLMCECLNIDPMTRPSKRKIRSIVQILERRPRIFVQGNTHFLLKDPMTIGESTNCDIAINDPWACVEDVHATLRKIGSSWYIFDNNSQNGLFVKKANRFVRVEEASLHDGDYIALGYSDRKGSHISLRFRT